MSKSTPGPWQRIGWKPCGIYGPGDLGTAERICHLDGRQEHDANARLIAAAPDMLDALKAEEEADAAFDAADEYTRRADAEGWLNDPTGSCHVAEAWDRANKLRATAKELRRTAISKATGESR